MTKLKLDALLQKQWPPLDFNQYIIYGAGNCGAKTSRILSELYAVPQSVEIRTWPTQSFQSKKGCLI